MRLEFSNVHFEREIRTKWDVLLRILGDFAVSVGGRIIYREVDFCLVEFAVALGNWLVIATDLGPDFVYTSLESETEGLVRFTRLTPGAWRVTAAHQEQEAVVSLTTIEVKDAALAYIGELRTSLLGAIDILQYVDDARVREELGSKLMSP